MERNRIASSVLNAIGETPLVRLNKISEKAGVNIFAKLEFLNPSGSIKDRIALYIIESAEKKGILKPGSTIVEATSGNTGISIAMVAAVKGYNAILVMPDNTAKAKRQMMHTLNAKIVLVPEKEGMESVVRKAGEIAEKTGGFLVNQFSNEDNVKAHYEGTGMEILRQLDERIDAFVAGVGTGGTLIGVGKALKEKYPNMRLIAVEPENSPALYNMFYGRGASKIAGIPHVIEGIGEGFVSKILRDNLSLVDRVMLVSDEEAVQTTLQLARIEGLLCGVSSGANVSACLKVAGDFKGGSIVTVLPDGGYRYLDLLLKNLY
ncbi:MAG: cysteine synthase family protein [Candidatus Brockarchaeota archaeon]|nr:cysteine synthase family protein [Candidatus Brockarchaeota archaeon]MBO3808217.1 cysteine synthase family protein [Candidatus Brockarchaeota archaeon]